VALRVERRAGGAAQHGRGVIGPERQQPLPGRGLRLAGGSEALGEVCVQRLALAGRGDREERTGHRTAADDLHHVAAGEPAFTSRLRPLN